MCATADDQSTNFICGTSRLIMNGTYDEECEERPGNSEVEES